MNKQTQALKLALEGLEKWHFDKDPRGAADYITAIRDALADSALDRMAENARELGLNYEPAQKQEPVAWRYNGNLHEFDPSDWATGPVTPLYTSPPASKLWVGLMDEEIIDMYNEPRSDAEMVEFARAIEAKLKEKNT